MSNKKKVFIKTYGCQMNEYDSEKLVLDLEKNHYQQTGDIQDADMVLLNTCNIREKAAEKVYSELGRIKKFKDHKADLKIGVTGCVAQAESSEIFDRQPAVDFIVGPQSYHKFPEIISKLKDGERNISETSFQASDKFKSIASLAGKPKPSAFVTIQEGCDKFCTFCVVPYTRGKEVSRSQRDILNEIRESAKKGVKEVILLGQNVNAYNFEGISFSSLIYSLAEINEIKRIRFMTSHPRDMTDELITAFGDIPKLMPFLHLPVQSGSNRILKSMNRGHIVEEYVEIVNKLRSVRSDICFSSDFIVGYPGETDKDFQETIDLCEQVEFAQAYSFNYSSRPGTPASRKEELDENLKKTRLHILQDLLSKQQSTFLKEQKNTQHKVLFEKVGRGIDEYVGRTEQFSPVTVVTKENILGEIKKVEINSVMSHSLKGDLK
ncbi:MAG: tRNA (N6-isopentenyl adenosine(37)-C2)-methylthiotransferase MiaB [Gammaproteobacteria bacterium]|nr:tRNA (N6-isopentenyl adenosine(37)-C2)-methylthiotransferase MiaB [Gammaproteobacteria bacterium]